MKNKEKLKNILLLLSLIIFPILEIIKLNIFNLDNNISKILLRTFILIIIFIINNLKFKKYKLINNILNFSLIIGSALSLIFNSFNVFGFLLLYLFLLLISLVCMTKTKLRFEISLVMGTSILILFFIIIGLLNLLKFSLLILILITFLSVWYLYKNKKQLEKEVKKINNVSLIIFSILFLIAILGGVGRYVHKWDEYSYWAYAAKVCIQEDSLYSVISHLGATKSYPPVSTIWHYIVSVFVGFSEPNLYIGLSVITFIFFMPLFMKIIEKRKDIIIIFVIASVSFPMVFNGSISYSLLYVDLLLGILCGTTLIIHNEIKEKNLSKAPLILLLILITLLKTNGFVFSCTLLLLFYLKEVFEGKASIKKVFITLKKYIIPGVLIIISFISWRVISNTGIVKSVAYEANLLPDILKMDIAPKLEPTFILNFFHSVISSIDEDIVYSFINIPLFVYLIIIFGMLYVLQSKEKNIFKVIAPYLISYIVFFGLTALSLFVMFSLYEASELASFGRYLAPINIAYMMYCLYKISFIKKDMIITCISVILICFVGFYNISFFITDIKDRRNTIHIYQERTEVFSPVIENTPENSRVFIINQEDVDNIMPIWYARYYCYPRIVNSNPNAITWKVKTESNAWDLKDWGLTSNTFGKHLIDYDFDYVFLYTYTDEFYETLENYFYDLDMAKKSRLFKIESNNKKEVKLVPVELEV